MMGAVGTFTANFTQTGTPAGCVRYSTGLSVAGTPLATLSLGTTSLRRCSVRLGPRWRTGCWVRGNTQARAGNGTVAADGN